MPKKRKFRWPFILSSGFQAKDGIIENNHHLELQIAKIIRNETYFNSFPQGNLVKDDANAKNNGFAKPVEE